MQAARSVRDDPVATDMSVPFPSPPDTSSTVPEFPLVSRALMLQGGSTDAVLEDFDGDGASDLAVAVSESNLLSVFFRQADGTFLSHPSRNVSLQGIPVALGVVDRYENGNKEIVVLQRKSDSYEYDHFVRVNTTTWVPTVPVTVAEGAVSLSIGNFTGTQSPDIAVVSEGANPPTSTGSVQVFVGPLYSTFFTLVDAPGTSRIVCGDYDDDGSMDVAVANRLDSTVEVFCSPLTFAMAPNSTLDVSGDPVWLASGAFNGDSLTDLVVACQEPSSLQFFLQSSSTGIPTTVSLQLSLPVPPSRVVVGDMDSDSRTDLLVSSESACRILGYFQGTSPVWPVDPSFSFPSGSVPRGAVIGDMTGDGAPDLGVTSARDDWSGSSMAVYPSREPFSNSNHTVWTSFSQPAAAMAVGDIDGDGREDLVVSVPGADAFEYMLGYGEAGTGALGYVPDELMVEDLDGDGLSDVLTSNRSLDRARVDFGSADLPGASMDHLLLVCSGNVSGLVVGDFNGDGYPDIAAGTSNGTIDMFYNTGSAPAFGDPDTVEVSASLPVLAVAAGDFDSDGLEDIVYTAASDLAHILLQEGSEHPISLPYTYDLQASPGPISRLWSGDVTGDGKDDVIAADASCETLFLFDQEDFLDTVAYETVDLPEAPSYISITDVTDDERSDLLVVFPSADLLFLYKQSGSSLPSSPSMTFVTGAGPVSACMGDATGEGVGDLQVLDSASGSVSVFERIVLDVGPTAMFALSSTSPEEGQPFWFIDQSTGYDPIVSWVWTMTYPDMSIETWALAPEAMSAVMFEVGDGGYAMQLQVSEADGDADTHLLEFSVLEVAPHVALTVSPPGGIYLEFQAITFTADVESLDPVVLYEWDFDSPGDEFVPDAETVDGSASFSYGDAGGYTVRVRASDSDGSVSTESVAIAVLDAGLSGTFDGDVTVTRDPDATYVITFNASALATLYPDISGVVWEFGDGAVLPAEGPPSEPVTHSYTPDRDYTVNVSLSDDDGNDIELIGTLHMVAPSISLISPANGSVLAPGASVMLSISDDSFPLVSVRYSVDGGEFTDFDTLYSISTAGWGDGLHVIEVMAEDCDGNVARRTVVSIFTDATEPTVTFIWEGETAYGGDRLNVTVHVDDASGEVESVMLYVDFPGEESQSQLVMHSAGDGVYYAMVEVPKREGTLVFSVRATDLAGNVAVSDVQSVEVRLRFIDAAWPYLLLIAAAAAVGTAAYFLREASIAVDETFVIYGDGRLLAHSTRRLKPGMDDQILSGMFVAIQDFIHDSFKGETSFRLRKLDFGEKSVLVEKGEHLFLAVVLHGRASRKVSRRMKGVLDDIEGAFAEHLRDWDGDLDKVRGVNDRVKRLYSKAPMLPRAHPKKDD